MTNQPLFNVHHDYVSELKLRTISIAGVVLATALTVGAVASNGEFQKLLMTGGALGILGVSRLAEGERRKQDLINQDVSDISDAARQQLLYQQMTSTDALVPADSPETAEDSAGPGVPLYDLADISKENHTAIVGSSGSGKSFLTQWLIKEHFPSDSDIVALDTDASPTEWPGLPVVGVGGDVTAIKSRMQRDLAELQMRTERQSVGSPVGSEIVRIVEEFPNLQAEIEDGLEKGEDNIAGVWLRKVLRRGRKYSMKLVLVSQEWEVASLGISGEGSLRKAFTILYLGNTAFSRLDTIRDKNEREALRQWLKGQKRPAIAESGGMFFGCPIPDIQQDSPRDRADRADTLGDLAGIDDGPTIVHDSRTGKTTTMNAGISQGSSLVVQDTADDSEDSEILHRLIGSLIDRGVSRSEVLKVHLGYGGRRYADGRALLDELENRHGPLRGR